MNSKKVNFIKFFTISIFIFIILAIIFTFVLLKNGISLNSFELKGIKFERLYLKLDNKLQLDIDKISITPSNQNSTLETYYIIEAIEYFPLLFEKVNIKSLQLTQAGYDFDLHINFSNDIFQIDSNEFYLYSNLQLLNKKEIVANPVIYLKKQQLYFLGLLHINLLANEASAQTNFYWYDADGMVSFTRKNKEIQINLTSGYFENLSDIFVNFKLHPAINAWTYEYITADKYKLDYLTFTHSLDKPLSLYNLEAKATAYNVKVKFDPRLPEVDIKEVSIFFKDGKLLFDLDTPTYQGKSIDGSFVYISDLIDKKSDYISINIKADTIYDKDIQAILEAYGINLVVTQDSGTIDADITIKIFFASGAVEAKGKFFAQDAIIDLLGYKLPIKEAYIDFKDNAIILRKIKIADDEQVFDVNGVIDADKKLIDLNFKVKHYMKYQTKIEDISFKVLIDYNDAVKIDVPFFNFNVVVDEGVKIEVDNIQNLTPYFPQIPININSGKIVATSQDFTNYEINATLNAVQHYFKSTQYIEDFLINASYNSKIGQIIISVDDKLLYNHNKNELTLRQWDLDLSPIFEKNLIDIKSSNSNLSIYGINSALIINDHKLVSDNYNLHIKDSYITLESIHNKSKVNFLLKGNQLSFNGEKLDDYLLHPLLNFKGIVGGEYRFEIQGTLDKLIGKVEIKGGLVTNMKSYNNLIALINTIPSLAVFKTPGFNEQGMDIEYGTIEFKAVGQYIFLDKLFIKGKSANIVGTGYIDVKNEKIDLDLKIQTIRELGKAIGSIPIAGYIIFGEDKSLSFTAKVEGNLNDPKVRTQTVSEIITTPLHMMLRTIESPFKLLRDIFAPKKKE